jgi:hypothetical protein
MPRPLRIEYAGAIYHALNRGDRREDIFRDNEDRRLFLSTLGGGLPEDTLADSRLLPDARASRFSFYSRSPVSRPC